MCADEGRRIACNRNWVRSWERFRVKVLKDGKVALQGGRRNKWCADEGHRIACNRNWVRGWEKFTVVYHGGRMISLKGGRSRGTKFCADEGHTTKCNRAQAATGEKFKVKCLSGCNSGGPAAGGGVAPKPKPDAKITLTDGMVIGFKGGRWKKLCADEGWRIRCNRNHLKSWEKFTVKTLKGGKIALKGGKDGRWCADQGNTIRCNRNWVRGWEKFSVIYHGGNSISLKGGRGHKYCADEGRITKCNRIDANAWEKFDVQTVHKWLFGKGAKPMVCVDPDNEGTVIHSKAEMIKMKAEKQKAEVEEIKNAKIVNGEIKKMEGVEGCKKNCEGSHEDKPSDAEGASGETGSETDPEVNAELVNEKAQVEVEAAKTEAALEKAEHAAEETEAKEDQIAEDKEKAEEEKNSSDPEKKKAAEAALAKAQADEKKLEKEEEDASKTAKKAEEDGLKAMTKAAADGKKKAEAKDKEVSEKKAEDDKKKTAALLAAAVAPAAAAATKAATDSAAKSTKNAFDEATKEAARLPGGGKGAAGRGSYFCCSQENALGGVSTLEEADDAGFRAAALPFVQFVESTYDSAQLPDVISERKLFQQGKISVEHALNLDKATVSEDGTFHYSLTVPAVKALCGEKAEALSAKEPAGEDLPVQEAVAPAMEGKPVDKGKVGAIVAKAGGPDKASNFCTTCGKGERMHPYSADGIKAAGVALLQKDCKEGSDGVEKVDIKLQFQDDGAMKLAVKANSHEVIEHVYKSKLEELCVPVCFNTVKGRCDYGKKTPHTEEKNILANRVSQRRAMYLADLVIGAATKDGALSGCEKKFIDMKPPDNSAKLETSRMPNDNPVLSSSFSSDEITMEEGGQDLAGVMGPSYERQFPRQRDRDDDVRQADSFIEEV
eukprot:g1332.t1